MMLLFFFLLFKKTHYTFEQVDDFEYETAFMLHNENIKYYEFPTRELVVKLAI